MGSLIELEPCPKCGERAAIFDDPMGWQIHCLGPFDCSGRTFDPMSDANEAISAWNTRATMEASNG